MAVHFFSRRCLGGEVWREAGSRPHSIRPQEKARKPSLTAPASSAKVSASPAALGCQIKMPRGIRAEAASSANSSGDSEIVALLKGQVGSLQKLLVDFDQDRVEAIVNLERLRGEMNLLRLQGKHDLEKLETVKNQKIAELEDRQARDGIEFILKNRTISARGAMEWAEREIRRLRFPGERPDRRQIWSYTIKSNKDLSQELNDLGWAKSESPARLVDLYKKISNHIHDKHSPEMTANRPIIILEEGTGDGFLTAAEAGAIKCICRLFRLSYDAYQRDPRGAEISTNPDEFRALSNEDIKKATLDFYAQAEADAVAARVEAKNRARPARTHKKKSSLPTQKTPPGHDVVATSGPDAGDPRTSRKRS